MSDKDHLDALEKHIDADRRSFIKTALTTGAAIAAVGSIGISSASAKKQPASQASKTGQKGDHFDYVIVGAGSAGAVLTRRLVDAGFSVLLLEAGPTDKLPAIHNPPDALSLSYTPQVAWQFNTQEQKTAGDQKIFWPRGKTLGGSSAINGMMYVRGLPVDYDTWAFMGADGWGWKDVLPYFQKAENCHITDLSDSHGKGGLLQVSRPKLTELGEAFCEAAQQYGLPYVKDYNDGNDSTGVSRPQYTITADGKRASSWVCYGQAVANAPNLTIATGARVLKLLMSNTRTTGVRYAFNGEQRDVYVNKEVLLCAGSLMSPAILMRSGIGRADDLQKVGIKAVQNLSGVGENLHDHLVCPFIWESKLAVPVGKASSIEGNIFHKSHPDMIAPDTQSLLFTVPFPLPGFPEVKQGFSVVAGLDRPRSRGRLWLASADPMKDPLFDPRVFSEKQDLEVMTDKALLLREVMKQPALAPWRGKEVAPGNTALTREAVRDYVNRYTGSYHHQVGTARMGRDEMSVVGPDLKVHGIEGLRVVDASVMPVITTGNTNAPTIMIAEKAADMILSSAKSS
ncbi:GMC family oxidoreductase [Acinetobacter sp. WZC-1]|uniref:GMC family oxidoreductase n=1 Tax=Acinetobacter sp. WZC-1 TaxID=3459034 RepID=UPI00403D78A4